MSYIMASCIHNTEHFLTSLYYKHTGKSHNMGKPNSNPNADFSTSITILSCSKKKMNNFDFACKHV